MIQRLIQKLAQLDRKQRRLAGVGVLVTSAVLCYFLIAHNFIHDFQQANSAKDACELERQGLELVHAELAGAEKTYAKVQAEAADLRARCCTTRQADQFFGQITTWATDFHLTPFSRVVKKPEPLLDDPNGLRLYSQAADIVLQGQIHDLIAFLDMLMDRPQRVGITNLQVGLKAGAASKPHCSFRVALVVDSQVEGKTL